MHFPERQHLGTTGSSTLPPTADKFKKAGEGLTARLPLANDFTPIPKYHMALH